jgi:hypothetical protein
MFLAFRTKNTENHETNLFAKQETKAPESRETTQDHGAEV